ncbi:hypothetical protein [Parasitella parasitica]|uniref:Uncharacterized protein n=1 Tax=Parasitella parasitica TaxID=35722 RepID=A0A0B7MWW7_9FUNG|nr:hypothetical protein [Parasitella parasitica]
MKYTISFFCHSIEMNIQRIAFQYPCYMCKEVLFTAIDVMSHVICEHGFMLHQRPEASRVIGGEIRPPEKGYEYMEFPFLKEETDSVMIRSACPSCWYHCAVEDFEEFKKHIKEAHDPQHYMFHHNLQEANSEHGEYSGSGREPPQKQEQEEVVEPTLEDVFNKIQELQTLFCSHFSAASDE